MIIDWLIYGVVVSALVGVAAWLMERGARAQRWPARWVWAGALVVSSAGPLLARLLPRETSASVAGRAPVAFVMESMPALVVAPAASTGPSLDTLLLGSWAAASALLLVVLGVLAVRLGLRLRRWPSRLVDGVEVRVSPDTGPAATGLFRGRVVVPEWALALEPEQRRLLVLHEAEHVRARDPQLALAGLLICVLTLWNLPLWWQLRRLRLAMEVDCDARVLGRDGDPRTYGALLLEVGQRKAHLALALAEPRTMLERRIRMITRHGDGRRTFHGLTLMAAAGLVLAMACETPGPTGPAGVEQRPLAIEDIRAAVEAMECEPVVFLNDTQSTLDAVEEDDVEAIYVFKGSATAEMHEDGEACGVIVVLTKGARVRETDGARRLVERLSAARLEQSGAEGRREQVALKQVLSEPTFTPMTIRPQLKNPGEVTDALQQLYPPVLRDAGIGGRVSVWFLIDREGVVQRTLIKTPSDQEALNDAALAVA